MFIAERQSFLAYKHVFWQSERWLLGAIGPRLGITVWRNRTKEAFCIMIAWFMSRTVEGFVRYLPSDIGRRSVRDNIEASFGGLDREYFGSTPRSGNLM
jgi:hypothetical protein